MLRTALAALALACVCFSALAQVATTVGPEPVVSATTVTAPVGSWALAIAQWLNAYVFPTAITVVAGFVCQAIAKVYPWAALFLTQRRIEMMLISGKDYALNAVVGAAKGKVLSADLGSQVIATAVRYLIETAPPKVIAAAGGPEGIAKRIFRLLDLDDAADAANTLVPALKRVAP